MVQQTGCDGDGVFNEIYKLFLLLLKERLETLVIMFLRIIQDFNSYALSNVCG